MSQNSYTNYMDLTSQTGSHSTVDLNEGTLHFGVSAAETTEGWVGRLFIGATEVWETDVAYPKRVEATKAARTFFQRAIQTLLT